MASVAPYLGFNDNCEEAFNFYRSVLGGEFIEVGRFKDMECGDMPIGPEEANKIMHMGLKVGDTLLMGSDRPNVSGKVTTGDNVSIAYSPDSREDADRIFAGLADGGNVHMPLNEAFWGGYFGMLSDKFGIIWLINYQQEKA